MDKREQVNRDNSANHSARSLLTSKISTNVNHTRRGFAIAPILYLLGLIGVGAGILFSGYSQILRSNIQMTNDMTVKSDIQSIGTTMAAASVLSSTGSPTVLCPPGGSNASSACSSTANWTNVLQGAQSSNMPASYATINSAGNPKEWGVFQAAKGYKQLDPYGHYYMVCRWEQQASDSTDPALMVISAGPNGTLETTCGNTSAQGDDTMILLTAVQAEQRAAIWQVKPDTHSSSEAVFGQTGSQLIIDSMGNLTVPGATTLSSTLAVTGTTTLTSNLIGNAGATFTNTVTAANFSGSIAGLSGVFNAVTVGSTGQLTVNSSGNVATTGTLNAGATTLASNAVTGAETIGGTLGVTGATTLSGALTAKGATALGSSGQLTVDTSGDISTSGSLGAGAATLGSTSMASSAVAGNETVGGTDTVTGAFTAKGATALGSSGQLTVDASGDVSTSGTFHDAGATTLGGTLNVSGTTSLGGALSGTSAVFSGTVQAANFNGNATTATTAGNVTGVVSIANGGTGQTTASAALIALGGNNASNLTTGTVGVGLLPYSGVVAGTYNWGTVDSYGRVTYANNVSTSSITDGSGDSVTTSSSNGGTITFNDANSPAMTINGGNVGIGTTSPGTKLDVNGNIRVENAGVAGGTATPNQLQLMTGAASERWGITTDGAAESGSAVGSNFALVDYNNSGAVLGTPFSINRNTNAATFTGAVSASQFNGSGNGLTSVPASSITGTVTANVALGTSVTANNPQINGQANTGFYTPSASTIAVTNNGVESMRWASGGNVGIGTTNPGYKLSVNTASQSIDGINLTGADGHSLTLRASQGAGSNNGIVQSGDSGIIYSAGTMGTGAFVITPWANATSGLRLDNNGNVGIGTASPGSPLSVVGNSALTSGNYIATNIGGTQTVASTGSYYGLNVNPSFSLASGNTLAFMLGVEVNPSNASTGTLTQLEGVYTAPANYGTMVYLMGGYNQPQNNGSGNVSTMWGTYSQPYHQSSGAVGSMYGVMAQPIKTGTGPVSSMYGVYSQCQNTNATGAVTNCFDEYLDTPYGTGTITNKFGIYQVDANSKNYFGGNVGIGTASPTQLLDVNGGIHFVASTTNYSSQGGFLEWNQSGGGGETDFINAKGGGTGGFAFYNVVDGASSLGTPSIFINGSGNVGIGTASPNAGVALDLGSNTTAANSSLLLPIGSTATRPTTGIPGMIRYNSSLSPAAMELYSNSAWSSVITAATVGNSNIFLGTSVTANNPQINGDASTGLYTPAASTVAITTAGVERLRVNGSGNVGIGTTSPLSSLEIFGTNSTTGGAGEATYHGTIEINDNAGSSATAGAGGLEFKGSSYQNGFGWRLATPDFGSGNLPLVFNARANSATWSEVMRITNGGNVGIGTTSPGVGGFNASRNYLTIEGTSDIGVIEMTTPAAIAQGTLVGQMQFTNSGGSSGNTDKRVAGIVASYDNIVSGDPGGALQFYTHQGGTGSSTYSEKMRISNTGNVGIGTTSPTSPEGWGPVFTVSGGVPVIYLNSTATNAGSWSLFSGNGGTSGKEFFAIRDTTASASRLAIDSAGNVGIGTSSPAYTLDVQGAGTIHSSGRMFSGAPSTGGIWVDGGTAQFVGSDTSTLMGLYNSGWGLTLSNTGAVSIPGSLTVTGAETVSGTLSPASISTGSITMSGNLTFTAANPYIYTGGSWVGFPNGIYAGSSGGTNYFQSIIEARGGIANDSAAYLTINGGTSGYTYFAGNVGIGTTAPGVALDVVGLGRISNSGQDAYLTLNDTVSGGRAYNLGSGGPSSGGGNGFYVYDVTGGATRMTINGSGQIGMGAGPTSPGAQLQVNGASTSYPALSVGDTTGIDNGATYGMVNLTRAADTTKAHLAFIRSGSYVWQMGYVSGTNTFGIFPWNFSGTQGTPTMAFSGTNVGIGTTGPGYKLDVSGDVRANSLIVNGGGTWTDGAIYSDANWGMLFRPKVAGAIAAYSFENFGASANLLTILNGGNVGIGTTAPGYNLTVNPVGTTANIEISPQTWSTTSDYAQLVMGDTNHYYRTTWGTGTTIYDGNAIYLSGAPVTISSNLTVNGTFSPSSITTSSLTVNGASQFNGTVTATGNGSFNGAGIGFVTQGFYIDSSNLALRTPTSVGTIYFQNASGAATYGTINNGGLNISIGNLTFSAANPSITSAGSYIVIPNGLYVSGGILYSGALINARSGISNDTASYLQINGGTSGYTYFTGNVGIGTASPGSQLEIGTNAAFSGRRLRLLGYANTAGTDAALEIGDGNSVYWRMARNSSNTFQTDMSGSWAINGGAVTINNNLTVNGTFNPSNLTVSTIYGSGSSSSYGALTIQGSKNGWGGIDFNSGSGNMATLMVSGDTVGFYNAANSGWDWYWNGGTLAAGQIPAANINAGTLNGSYALTGALSVAGTTSLTGNVAINTAVSTGYTLLIGGNGHTTGNWVVGGSFAIGGAGAPNGYFDVRTNGSNDGIVMYQPADNQSSIQSYIDGHWTDRTTYGGPCCNLLNINTDVGYVTIGNTLAGGGISLNGYTTVNNSMNVTGTVTNNGETVNGSLNATGGLRSNNIAIGASLLISPVWPYETISNNSNLRLATTGGVYFHTGSYATTGTTTFGVDGSGNGTFLGNMTASSATVNGTETVSGNLTAGTTAQVRSLTVLSEMALTQTTNSGTVYFNVSNTSGSLGGNYSLVIRGLGSNGGAQVNMANLYLQANTTTIGGNLNFTAANPSMTSGGSYIVVPNSFYISTGGTPFYTEAIIEARGGIADDTSSYLTINGGTSGNTYFSGNVGIGTGGPASKLDLNGGIFNFETQSGVGYGQLWNDSWVHLAADNASGQTMALSAPGGVYFRNTSGGTSNAYISTTGGQSYFNGSVLSGGYYLNSDARLKHDIQPDAGHGLATVDQMRSVHFKWNKDDRADYGVIAQDVQKLIPEAVATDAQGFLEVQYDKLVLPVIEAVKELHALVKDLQAKVAALLEWQSATDKRLDAMQKQIKELELRNKHLDEELQKAINQKAHHAAKPASAAPVPATAPATSAATPEQ